MMSYLEQCEGVIYRNSNNPQVPCWETDLEMNRPYEGAYLV